MIAFTVPGEPVAYMRATPRIIALPGRRPFAIPYDPKESKDFKSRVAAFAKGTGFFQAEGPLKVIVRFYFKRPKYAYTKRFGAGAIETFRKPDIDNAIKNLFDGLNGIVYRDDAQIAVMVAMKFYHEIGGQPRTEVEIYQPKEEVKPKPAEQGMLFA